MAWGYHKACGKQTFFSNSDFLKKQSHKSLLTEENQNEEQKNAIHKDSELFNISKFVMKLKRIP